MANKASVLTSEPKTFAPTSAPEPETDEHLTAELLAQENRRHDRVLAGLVFLLGFLLASFPVTNSDIWMHLRTGQMIANGDYRFGVDPFAYTTEGSLWVNHSWLCDLLFYVVYALANGAGLVLLRGLAVVGIMVLMFRTCRRDGSLLAAVIGIGLGVVTLSHRLLLRPDIASFFFLALTLYLLLHPRVQPRQPFFQRLVGLTNGRLWVLLPAVFLLWANLDAWFFLGVAMVGLYFVGELITSAFGRVTYRPDALSPAERKSLAVVLAVGLLACLVNPYFYRVFELPGELHSETLKDIKSFERRLYDQIAVSPFEASYFAGEPTSFRPKGLSIAQWCYYPLALLGLLSFVLNLRQGHWSRFMIWLGFFALSVYQVRNIGFFAVVAAPLTTLNLQDWLRTRFGELPSIQRRRVAGAQLGRIAVLLALVTLTALTIYPYEDPRLSQRGGRQAAVGLVNARGSLGWSLFTDASSSQCIHQMREWREAGSLTGRPFYFDWINQPNYAAWFDPAISSAPAGRDEAGGRGAAFLDTRFKLHKPDTVHEFFDTVKKLEETFQGPAELRDPVWQAVFKKYDISHLVISTYHMVSRPDPTDARRNRKISESLVNLLLQDRDPTTGRNKWELLRYIDGRTAVLAWTGSPHWGGDEKPGPLQKLRYNPVEEAFRAPQEVPAPERTGSAANRSGLLTWLEGEVRQPPLAYEEASWHIDRAQIKTAMQQRLDLTVDFATHLFKLPLFPASGPFPGAAGTLGAAMTDFMPTVLMLPIMPMLAPEPEAEILLAIRAARRALAAHPDHGDSYYALYQAYGLWQELRIEPALSPLRENPIRQMQVSAALRSAAVLKPEDWERQVLLARMYLQTGLIDLGARHYRAAYNQFIANGPPREFTGSQEQFEKSVGEMFQRIWRLPALEEVERNLRERQANFNLKINSVSSLLEAANIAQESLLADERRQYLEKALQELPRDRPEYQQAFTMLIDLYVEIGDLPDARILLYRPEAQAMLGPRGFSQRAIAVEGGLGYYQEAARALVQVDDQWRRESVEQALTGLHLQTIGGDSFGGLQQVLGFDQPFQRGTSRGIQLIPQRVGLSNQMGLLALEAGEINRAAVCFRRAAMDFDDDSSYRPLAVRYYQLLTGKTLDTK